MQLLCSVTRIDVIDDIWEDVDGIIVGSCAASLRYPFTLDELVTIKKKCQMYGIDLYIEIDVLVKETSRTIVFDLLDFVMQLEPKGIYFSDLAVYDYALRKGYSDILIYDPLTLMTNSLDAIFFLRKGLKAVTLARELTFDEIVKIARMTNGQVDMQIAGYIRMAYSGRHFISDYLSYIKKQFDDQKIYSIKEETRDKKMVIHQGDAGTLIYSEFVLLALDEYLRLKDKIARFIIDDHYLDHDLFCDIVKAHRIVNKENVSAITTELKERYPDIYFDTGYLYNKTMIRKEEDYDRTVGTE